MKTWQFLSTIVIVWKPTPRNNTTHVYNVYVYLQYFPLGYLSAYVQHTYKQTGRLSHHSIYRRQNGKSTQCHLPYQYNLSAILIRARALYKKGFISFCFDYIMGWDGDVGCVVATSHHRQSSR